MDELTHATLPLSKREKDAIKATITHGTDKIPVNEFRELVQEDAFSRDELKDFYASFRAIQRNGELVEYMSVILDHYPEVDSSPSYLRGSPKKR